MYFPVNRAVSYSCCPHLQSILHSYRLGHASRTFSQLSGMITIINLLFGKSHWNERFNDFKLTTSLRDSGTVGLLTSGLGHCPLCWNCLMVLKAEQAVAWAELGTLIAQDVNWAVRVNKKQGRSPTRNLGLSLYFTVQSLEFQTKDWILCCRQCCSECIGREQIKLLPAFTLLEITF
jgi:hypothetical protein